MVWKKDDRYIDITMFHVLDGKENKRKIPLRTITLKPDEKVELKIRLIRENTVVFEESNGKEI